MMTEEEMKFGAIHGFQYIPLFRSQQRKSKKQIGHEDIMQLVKRSEWVKWDFNYSIGDTILEKYEGLYVQCHEITEKIKSINFFEVNRIVSSPDIASIFETATSGFYPDYENVGDLVRVGVVNNRWTIFKDYLIPKDLLLVTQRDLKFGMVLQIQNFII